MTIVLTFFLALCSVGILLILLQLRKPATPLQQDFSKELAKAEKELETTKADYNKKVGENKQMYAENERLKAELNSLRKERDRLESDVTKFETRREQQERESKQMAKELESAKNVFEEERARVIEEEKEQRRLSEEMRDRMWAEHEVTVIANLVDLCKQPHLQFTGHPNNKLPEDEFHGSLKPDFVIEFLGQYVIFDAKVSKAQSLQTYIDESVKKTAEKVKKGNKIYPHVFLVVPTQAIPELRKVIYVKDDFTFYVVSREALAPILASLKRISTYELASELDPQKREGIINIIADLAMHISTRNAYELLLTKLGTAVLEKTQKLEPELIEEVERRKSEQKFSQLSAAELKKLASNLTEQNKTIQELVSPKAAVTKQSIEEAQMTMVGTLID